MTRPIVSLIPIGSYDDPARLDEALRQALEPFGGMGAFVRPGQRVLLKPNLVAPAHAELAVCTHPAVAAAVVRAVTAAGASQCDLGDGPGVSTASAVCRSCGIADALRDTGARILDFEETAVYEHPDNRVLKRVELTAEIARHDVLITLPKLKTHCQMAMTCAIKNQYGLIPGSAKAQLHFRFQDRQLFSDLVLDINRAAAPALAIVDAIVAMEGPGPSGGTPRQVGALIVGTDLAAVDTVAAALIGLSAEAVPLLAAARQAGFGATALADIDVRGARVEELAVPDFRLVAAPTNMLRLLPLPLFMLKWLRRQFVARPVIRRKACVRCGRCRDGCPVRPPAIDPFAPPGSPTLNDRTCIRCYCCHEFCPAKAIDLEYGAAERHLHLLALTRRAHRLFGRLVAWLRR